MSLLDDAFEPFVIMERRAEPDGYGGKRYVWTEGMEIQAAATLDTSIQARVGEVQGVTSLYTITTSRTLTLEYHDVIKRLSDNKVFRVTSDGDDKKTPRSATLDMRQVSAEEYVPTGG